MNPHRTAASPPDCEDQSLLFHALGARQVVADFSGDTVSTDGGALLVREVNHRPGLARALAGCFEDQRDPRFVDHSLEQLLTQRLEGPALEKILPAIRRRGTRARMIVRGDNGFGREELLAWCERHGVYYGVGLQKNPCWCGACNRRGPPRGPMCQ